MLIRNMKNQFLSIGKKMDGPVFLKEYEGMEDVIAALEEIKEKVEDPEVIQSIEFDQLYIKQGDIGEKNVYYELKNSFLPMYVLHDVKIQDVDYYAQLDYVIITNTFICILETKKLNGDITIKNSGDFVRAFKSPKGKVYKREGMYSPISQNQRHVRILDNLLKKNKLIKHTPIISLVVMANPKNIINYKFAPKEIKKQIIKYDQLTPFLEKEMDIESEINIPIVTMQEIAQFLLEQHVDDRLSFVRKYDHLIKASEEVEVKVVPEVAATVVEQVEEIVQEKSQEQVQEKAQEKDPDVIRERLVAFRKKQSKEENIAAYMVFNNKHMEDLLNKMPQTKEELHKCSGFGPVKVEKYGDAVLECFLG